MPKISRPIVSKRPRKRDQSKSALAEIFNHRIDQLKSEGADERFLPEKITDPEAFTHRELRQIRSAASKAKSSGVRQVGGGLIPEITGSYYEALNDIVNARRRKWRKIAQESGVTVEGEPSILKRGEMGDTRSRLFKEVKKYQSQEFRSAGEYMGAIRTMHRMAENARGEQFKNNLMQAIYHKFGGSKDPKIVHKAKVVVATINRASAEQVLRAYFREEVFTIHDVYESDLKEGLLDKMIQALDAVGAKIRYAYSKDWDKAAELLAAKAAREKAEFIKLNS